MFRCKKYYGTSEQCEDGSMQILCSCEDGKCEVEDYQLEDDDCPATQRKLVDKLLARIADLRQALIDIEEGHYYDAHSHASHALDDDDTSMSDDDIAAINDLEE